MSARAIIVPLDGSVAALAAVPVARALAALEGATLHIVHVSDPVVPAEEALSRLYLSAEDAEGAVIDTLGGAPAARIAEVTRRWNGMLVVMCPHVGHPDPSRGLGSVANEVLHDAQVPVVLVPPGRVAATWRPRKLVLPLDGTPACGCALDPAAQLAARMGGSLVLVHVAGPRHAEEPGTFAGPMYMDQPQHEWPAWTDEFTQRAVSRSAEVCACEVTLKLVTGDPGPEIVHFAEAENADLIVVAWHGTMEAHHAETLKAVVRGVTCPVMVMRLE